MHAWTPTSQPGYQIISYYISSSHTRLSRSIFAPGIIIMDGMTHRMCDVHEIFSLTYMRTHQGLFTYITWRSQLHIATNNGEFGCHAILIFCRASIR